MQLINGPIRISSILVINLELRTCLLEFVCILQLPDGVNISKDARLAISKAASVFVLYATSW